MINHRPVEIVSFLHLLTFAIGYLLGAIPFGFLCAQARGINILAVGSGNIGATNVRRTIGFRAGLAVLALDIGKGFLATVWPMAAMGAAGNQNLAALGLLGALLGHMFSVFLCFRGGKGVAVAIGGYAALAPNVLLLALLSWVVVFSVCRFVSLASLAFALMVPLCTYLFGCSAFVNIVALATTALIFLRHMTNMRRLLAGTEPRFGEKKKND
jgi:glycerol-3-phosphate acyltransferase PlsY